MLYKSGINLSVKIIEFIEKSTDLFIYVPYIKLAPLKEILDNTKVCKAIIVRWQPMDLILGSSDLEVYLFCKDNNITLYRNERLHLKAFVDNYKRCILGSANISARALNIPAYEYYNYELATPVENLSSDDKLYFSVILNESTLITDSVYRQLEDQLAEKIREFPNETDFQFTIEESEKHFLISSLPMTLNVKTLLQIYETGTAENEVELNCVIHDLALYNLPLNLTSDELRLKLKGSFFKHPFIKGFLENLEIKREIYFGAAKDWIHKNCADVPTPRKWEITDNIKILYSWIEELADGKLSVDRPNYSERLFLK